jgi:ribosomal protein L37AE/L43A
MPMNRVQFQKGLSMPESLGRYGTEERCEQALVAARWPSGFVCPACGVIESRTTFRRRGRLYWQCAGCQHQCSVTSGTVFDSTKLPLTLQTFRHLHACSGCFRLERLPGGACTHWKSAAFSRRTPKAVLHL